MNRQKYNFMSLLAQTINVNFKGQLTEPVEWEKILFLAQKHSLLALIYEKASEDNAFLESKEAKEYFARVMVIVVEQTRRTQAFLKLYREFERAGVYPIVMKGIICRDMYGKYADDRPSSDEDILIQKQEYLKVKDVLVSCGFRPEIEDVTDFQMNEIQEICFTDNESGLHIEVHFNPIGVENDFRKNMNDYFKNVFERIIYINIQNQKIATMSYTDHMIFLVLHAFKHLASSGFGMRQTLDILLFKKKYGAYIDWHYVENVLEDVKADKFYNDLLNIGNNYMGFSFECKKQSKYVQELLDDILRSGTFGLNSQAQITSTQMVFAAMKKRKSKNSIETIIRAIFPGTEFFLKEEPQIENKPWLLLKCWIKRWLRFVKHNKQQGGTLAYESVKVGKKRIELLKKYDVL